MKAILVFCAMMSFPSRAVTYHAPTSPKEVADLSEARRLIREIAKQNEALALEQRNLDAVRGNINSTQNDRDRARGAFEKARSALDIHKADLANQAVAAVISAFGIAPDPPGNPDVGYRYIKHDQLEGIRMQWEVKFVQSFARDRKLPDKDGIPRPIEDIDESQVGAVALMNGRIEILEREFSSPAVLAAYIVHETVHFDQNSQHGRGDKISAMRAEMEAWSQPITRASTLGLTAAELQRLKIAEKKELEWVGAHGGIAPAFAEGDAERAKLSGDTDFLSAGREGSAIAVSEIARLREEQQRRIDDMERSAPAAAPRPTGNEVDPQWAAVYQWCGVACEMVEPRRYLQRDAGSEGMSREMASLQLEDYNEHRAWLLAHPVFIPRDQLARHLEAEQAGSDSCEDRLLRILLDADGPVDVNWLASRVEAARADGSGTALERIAHALGGRRPVVVAPASRSAGARSGRTGSQAEPLQSSDARMTPDRSNRIPELNGPASTQLRGISAGGSWN